MTLKEIFFLQGRNMLGTLKKGYVNPDEWAQLAFITWIAHTALLPISLLIGATFKTLFDVLTRSKMPVDLDKATDNVDKLQEQELNALVETISQYNAKSNSSRDALEKLQQADLHEKATFTKAHQAQEKILMKKRKEANLEEIKSTLGALADKAIIEPKSDLTAEDKFFLTEHDREHKKLCADVKIKTQKEIIKEFLTDSKNEGKKLHQLICHSLFSPKEEKVEQVTVLSIETPTYQ
ncbi:hypothetical protein [Legionella cardiaca]|uniref:Uncharacterized protein n=1 Tax=Legionella cardiaca TaxID=1071983 RepID=A0ABY8ARW4_9GAMM|nr:hypothetical protein [Legionella cardiaca]WED42265.1 hypothetical protein PXX05_10035 [Legionella cardiaca]